jgi:predicted XRE-type DNA-binding protein
MAFNPYNINFKKLKESKKISDEKDLFKLSLLTQLNLIIEKLETKEILEYTGLDKSDLSRIRISNYQRFSSDRLINIISELGYRAECTLTKKKKA